MATQAIGRRRRCGRIQAVLYLLAWIACTTSIVPIQAAKSNNGGGGGGNGNGNGNGGGGAGNSGGGGGGGGCSSGVQKQLSATSSFNECSAVTGLRLDKKLNKNEDLDPSRSAFCRSAACRQVYLQLRSLGALACLQEYSTSSMQLSVEAGGRACFGSTLFETPSPIPTEVIETPAPSQSPNTTAPIVTSATPSPPPIESMLPPIDTISQSSSSASSPRDTASPLPRSPSSSTDGAFRNNQSSVDDKSRTSNSTLGASILQPSTTPIAVWLLVAAGAMVVVLVGVVCFIQRHRGPSQQPESVYIKGASTVRGQRAFSKTAELSISSLVPSSLEIDECTEEIFQSSRIPMEKLAFGELLSRGGYGEVYSGSYRGQSVAIKTLLSDQRKNSHQIRNFLHEIKLLAALEHERIVPFIGVAWDSLNELCVVMEFMERGDLRTLLKEYEASADKECGFDAEKVKIALQIAHGLVYLHSLDPIVVHRDLKSRNILLDNELNAKLTDFGVSRERGDYTMTAGVGSSLWMAPEVMLGERYDEKADVFSFGVVLSELDRHVLPYSHALEPHSRQRLPETAILQMVSMGRLTVTFTESADSAMAQLGRECVALDPAERPAASEVLHCLHHIYQRL